MSSPAYDPNIINPFTDQISAFEAQRQNLLAEGRLSVSKSAGGLAIVTTGSDQGGIYDPAVARSLEAQAEAVQEQMRRTGEYAGVVIMRNATRETFQNISRDRDLSGIVVIAHGTIGGIAIPVEDIFGWIDLAHISTDHLKQGDFWQAQCGHFSMRRRFQVPLGTFAVSKLSSVKDAPGKILPDQVTDLGWLSSVYNDHDPVMDQVYDLNVTHMGRTYTLDEHGKPTSFKRQR